MRAIGWVFVPNSLRLAALRVFGAQIGRGVLMRPRVRVTSPARLAIGEDSWIGEGVTLDGSGSIRIGANVVLSQAAVLRCPADAHGELVVEDGAWIALRARVTGPVTIGRRAVVGAAAVVSRDVAPGTVVVSSAITDDSDPDIAGPDL
ncbi:acetyltransferase [Gordonia sp. WA4-43]|uniref:acetyltransferase n=1 Tax=Gordonia sp. WA4-43 TaxID=2878678 RepID=UPI001CFA81C5|nr:acetyltransferase [Gordonia sp. WA4-43]UCZ89431.1 acetyltransferase [Gordonia sp. WA4-43]